jgi:plastocyanin
MTAANASHVAIRFLEALSVPALVGMLSVASACGGGGGGTASGSSSPTAPSPGGTGAAPAATVTIGSSVTPTDLRIEAGESIRFVNNSSRAHEMMSDPHPTHGSCPPIDRAGMLQAGASAVVGPFTLAGTCYYHDHNDPENASLRGQIRISVDNPGPGPNYIRP